MPTQTTLYTNAEVNGVQRTYLNKEYFDKRLLEVAKTRKVHAQYGQKRTIPPHSGKKAEFRRWESFDPYETINGLVEGVTPDPLDLSQSKVEVECKQYGRHIEVSDLLETTAYDDIAKGSTDELGELLGVVVEWVTRNAMCAGTNVQYAGAKTSRLALSATDKLTTTEVRKAVRTLKKAKARPFTRGENGKARKPHFICICSPDAVYDLQDDDAWRDVSKYSNAEQVYSGEIGRIFGVVFVESTEAKVFTQSVLNEVHADTADSASFVLENAPSREEAAYLAVAGNEIKIGATEYTIASYDAATKTVTLTTTATLSDGDIVYSEDAGAVDAETKAGADVHASLVFGKDAYGVVDIDGKGNMQTIIKPLGSAGAADPLDQRATFGAKVGAYTATILNNNWLVRIEHGVSA